jgi:hypothetical protein
MTEPMSMMEEVQHDAVQRAKLELLKELKQRVRDAYAKTDIKSARGVAIRVLDQMEKEIKEES